MPAGDLNERSFRSSFGLNSESKPGSPELIKAFTGRVSRRDGGRGGIRTHGEFYPTFDFESSALNRTQPPFLDAT